MVCCTKQNVWTRKWCKCEKYSPCICMVLVDAVKVTRRALFEAIIPKAAPE